MHASIGRVIIAAASIAMIGNGVCATARLAYPDRPLRFIVPFPPGGANDILARAVGDKLSAAYGQPVVLDNRAGAGGMVGTAIAAKAAPDGYTIVLVPPSHAINVTFRPNLTYDALKDFAPITQIATAAYLVAVPPSFAPKTVSELVAAAKKQPGQIRYGSAGIGNATHLIGELMATMAGIDLVHVPYKGGGPAMVDLMSGRLQLYFGTLSSTHGHAKAGRLRFIAVTSENRMASIPDVPTVTESGIPGFNAIGWWGVLAPTGVPAEIVNKLNRDINAIVREPKMHDWLRGLGFEPAADSPQAFTRFIANEIEKWGRVVKSSGARAD